jgi:hypothetical protein
MHGDGSDNRARDFGSCAALAAAPHLRSCTDRLLHNKRQLTTAAAVAMLNRGEGGARV